MAFPDFSFPCMTSLATPSPISELEPCGPSLEYDHEFAVLFARMVPRADAQYGSFVGTPEAPNWAEIERDCQRLLLRTKDINLLVWLCRARTRLGQSAGLAQGLGTLNAVLQTWPEAVHPQLLIEGEREPAVRANAVAALTDPEGLLGDVCDIVVSTSTALRLTVRDVERAFAIPRIPEALNGSAVSQQLAALRAAAQGNALAPVHCLAQAAGHVRAIDAWAKRQLGEDAPSLAPLMRVLDLFAQPEQEAAAGDASEHGVDTQAAAEANSAGGATAFALSRSPEHPPMTPTSRTTTRADVLLTIRAARDWFESHEPSSPVAVLLKQAERMVGKRFSQVADSIPLDLLQKWEAEPDEERSA